MFRKKIHALAVALPACLPLMWGGQHALAQTAPPAKAKPAAAAHAHGRAKLLIAIDGPVLTLAFESPLDNLVGFEHAPRTDKQKAALQKMSESLQQADGLFVPAPAARCSLQSVTLLSPVLEAMAAAAKDKPAAQPGAGGRHGGGDGHAELDATIVFRCEQPAQLRELEVRLFDRFAGLKRLDAQIASAQGQKAMQLSAGARRASW